MNRRVLRHSVWVKPDFARILNADEMHAYRIAWLTATLRFDLRGLATSRPS